MAKLRLVDSRRVRSRVRGSVSQLRLRCFSPIDTLYIHTYTQSVGFAWDPRKSERNLRDRGFDFEFAALIFEGPTVEVEDRRQDYGERRVIAIGVADGIALTVVYTDRTSRDGETLRRIISAHKANRRQRSIYQQAMLKRASS